jgi:hypothetical protein
MTRFLVNTLSEDGRVGEVTERNLILHNLMLIGPSYKDAFLKALEGARYPYFVQICICGRFVTYIEVPKNEKEENMMKFFDLGEDHDAALDAAVEIKDRWYGRMGRDHFQWFMEEFDKLKDVYEENYAAAELMVAGSAGVFMN